MTREPDKARYAMVRDELIAWPYTIHQIRDTLDVNLIEARGKQLLFQAMNSENLTAFVGSGVSAAYGRHTWSSWNEVQLGTVDAIAKAFLELASASLELLKRQGDITDRKTPYGAGEGCGLWELVNNAGAPANTFDMTSKRKINRWLANRHEVLLYAQQEVTGLYTTFEGGKSDGEFPGGERLPILFEIAQQLHEMLRSHSTLFASKDKPNDDDSIKNCAIGIWCDADTTTAPVEEIGRFVELRNRAWKGADFEQDLAVWELFDIALKAYLRLAEKPSAQLNFHELTKLLLVDEAAHAEHILQSALDPTASHGRSAKIVAKSDALDRFLAGRFEKRRLNLRRDIAGIRQDPALYLCLAPFKLRTQQQIIQKTRRAKARLSSQTARDAWGKILTVFSDHCEAVEQTGADDHKVFLTPSLRFMTGVMLRLHADPFTTFKHAEKGPEKDTGRPLGVLMSDLGRDDFTTRSSIIAGRLDPIRKLALDLKIKRYLTTNYDFEIERFFQDIGFERQLRTEHRVAHQVNRTPPVMRPEEPRTGRMGQVMQDMTFRRSNASDLFRFAAGADDTDVSIYHLHGRATDAGKIVVTERDYMNLYLREDNERDIVDEGIRLAFSANPIIFLGLGMTEHDILRPLRQFMSNHDKAIPHRSVVLMPAENNCDRRAKMSAGLYMRYGTHTIFYGDGEVRLDGTDEKYVHLDWLHRTLTLIKTLTAIAKDEITWLTETGKNASPKETKAEIKRRRAGEKLARLMKDLGTHEADGEKLETLGLLLGQEWPEGKTGTLDRLSIVHCAFRIGETRGDGRGDARVASSDYFGPEMEMLTEALRLVVGAEEYVAPDDRTAPSRIRDLRARVALLDGLYGAILTSSFNATLDGLHEGWRLWWQQWQQSPPQRLARFGELPVPGHATSGDPFPRRFVRHYILNTFTDIGPMEDETNPGNPGARKATGVRSFDTFIDAIDTSMASPKDRMGLCRKNEDWLAPGRRVTLVAAYRGLGKGAFVSAFASRLGLQSYIDAAWPQGEYHSASRQPLFVSAAFINLSFASEIASVFDMLLDVLFQAGMTIRVAEALSPDIPREKALAHAHDLLDLTTGRTNSFLNITLGQEALFSDGMGNELEDRLTKEPDLKKVRDHLTRDAEGTAARARDLSRIRTLRLLMAEFAEASGKFGGDANGGQGLSGRQPRLLFLIQSVELLYYRGGLTKNREIDDLLRFILLSTEAQSLPIDIVFVGNENALGEPWRKGPRKAAIKAAKNRHPAFKEYNRPGEWMLPKAMSIFRADADEVGREAVRKRARSSGLAALETGGEDNDSPRIQIHYARNMNPEDLLVDNFTLLAAVLFARSVRDLAEEPLRNATDKAKSDYQAAFTLFSKSLGTAVRNYRHTCNDLWGEDTPPDPRPGGNLHTARETFRKGIWDSVESFAGEARAIDVIADNSELGPLLQMDQDGVPGMLRRRYERSGSRAHGEWTLIRQTLRSNRFAFTILMAAAENTVAHEIAGATSFDKLIGAAAAAQLFIRAIVAQVKSVGSGERERFVLREVLDSGITDSVIGRPERDHRLQTLLIKHLAVIGCPVSCNVLVRAPEIRDYLDQVNDQGIISRRRQIARAMYALCDRGLAFRIASHPRLTALEERLPEANREKSWRADLEFRYAVHRSVQSHVISNLGGRVAEPGLVNSFAPSLYASMPSDLPRLRADGYQFLYQLVQTLSQYPDQPHSERVAAPIMFNAKDTATQVQALRAALSAVRTTFSISVVSRLDQEMRAIDEANDEVGFFEIYKINLRWIIRKAWEFMSEHQQQNTDRKPDDPLGMSDPPEKHYGHVNTLYRDEIVWLYNEVGLTCMVQGNLQDAVALLRQAIQFNRRIEGGSAGAPQHNRISLNLAICQIERGRLLSAARRLDDIEMSERTNSPAERVYALTRCYRGLINHLYGDRKAAEADYSFAEDSLRALEDWRGTALVLFHFANLQRDLKLAEEADRKMKEAIGFAEAGGHEDVRKRLLLTDCYHRLFPARTEDRFRDIEALRRLKGIEEYAREVGCMNLMADSFLIRAQVLIEQDETTTAGRLLTSAAGLCKRYSMNLRLNRIMTQYARLLHKRERRQAAVNLAKSSLAMAKRNSYRLEMERIQSLLDGIEAEHLRT